jgi:hypothetical protein
MPRVFISHASPDAPFVKREIVDLLHKHGIDTWFSPANIKTAEEWERRIRSGLQSCDWFLVALTPDAVASRWVEAEIAWGMEERPDCFVPVMCRNCAWKDLHLKMRTIQYVDFRQVSEAGKRRLLSVWNTGLRGDGARGRLEEPRASADELRQAEKVLRARQNLLILGCGSAERTSFCKALVHRLMARSGNDILPIYLNLQQLPKVAPESVRAHVLMAMLGDVARMVFACKYTALMSRAVDAELLNDPAFASLLDLADLLRNRLRDRSARPITESEFVRFNHQLADVLESKGWQKRIVFFDHTERLGENAASQVLVSRDDSLSACGLAQVFLLKEEDSEVVNHLGKEIGFQIVLRPKDAA